MLVLHSSSSLPFVELTLLLVSVAFDPSQGTSCPCIDGGQWTYQGGSYSYCSNPNSARTSWCPRELNADGSYTADLGFAFCEGDVLTACQAAKEANKPACPCVDGGAWKYRGKPQSYCSDPTNAGFTWCATAVDANGNFQSDYAICEGDVKEACDALKEAEPLPECPCLAGGQWTYDGEPQSYCQQPIGRAPWCPTSSASVTPATMGSVSVQYCEGRVLEACQVLEGTKIEDSCPCVQGGQWSHRGVQYSYCEEKNWCATEVDDEGKYIGKFARCKGSTKAACHQLHLLTTSAGQQDMYSDYTTANTGCPCWFDLTRSDCACCTDDGVQCGNPLHQWCTSRSEGRQAGCLGIPQHHWTLSTTGFPCFFNTSRTDCGWCAAGGAQCGEGPNLGQCRDPKDASYCTAAPGDCLRIDSCDSQADCEFDVKFGADHEHHKCVCKTGWTGNGVQCFDSITGEASVEMVGTSSGDVSLTMAVSSKYYVYPHNSEQFPTVAGETELLNNITALFDSGASCASRDGCNGTFVSLVESPQP